MGGWVRGAPKRSQKSHFKLGTGLEDASATFRLPRNALPPQSLPYNPSNSTTVFATSR
jgi:hypothetical protein